MTLIHYVRFYGRPHKTPAICLGSTNPARDRRSTDIGRVNCRPCQAAILREVLGSEPKAAPASRPWGRDA